MPTLLNPASPPGFPSQLTTPADGDPANAASVNVAFQAILDGEDAARLSSVGRRFRYWTLDGANIVVQPLGGFAVTSFGAWFAARHSVVTTVNAAAALGAGLAASTRYHLYARIVGGVVTFAAGLDGPDSGLLFRALSTDYLWVGTFITDSNAQVVPQIAADGKVRYPASKFLDGLTLLSTSVTGANQPFVPGIAYPDFAVNIQVFWTAQLQSMGGTVQGANFNVTTGFIAAAGFNPWQMTLAAGWGDWTNPSAGPVRNHGSTEIQLIPGGGPPIVYLGPSGTGALTGSMTFWCRGFDY